MTKKELQAYRRGLFAAALMTIAFVRTAEKHFAKQERRRGKYFDDAYLLGTLHAAQRIRQRAREIGKGK